MGVPVKTPVKVNFSGGLDLKTDDKQTLPSEFLSLDNMVFTSGGELTKRNGFPSFAKTVITPSPTLTYSAVSGTITAGRKAYAYNDELLVNDGFNLFSYDDSSNSWAYKGRSTLVDVSTQSIAQGVSTYVNADAAVDTTNNLRIVAYSGQGAVSCRYSVQDISTGLFIINQAAFGSSADLYEYPKVISVGGTSYVFAIKFADQKIYYQKIVGQVVTGSVTALITNLNATYQYYDVDVDTFSGNIYIAYLNSSGTPAVTISALSTSLAVGNTITVNATATNGVSWFGDGSNIWVVYATATVVSAFAVNNAVSATTGTAAVIDNAATAAAVSNVTGAWSTTQNKAFIFYDPTTFSSSLIATSAINYNTATISGGAVTATIGNASMLMGSVNLNSKAFAVSGIPHVVGLYAYPSLLPNTGTPTATVLRTIQATNFLLNLYNLTPTMNSTDKDVPGNIAAKIFPDSSTTLPPNGAQRELANPVGGSLSHVYLKSSGVYEVAMLNNSNYGSETTPYTPFLSPVGVSTCEFDFNLANPDAQTLGNNALIAGGQVGMYDGANACEQNFHIYPNSASSAKLTGGTGVLGLAGSNATYSYILVYEWIDNLGQVHRSFPSPVITPLTAGQVYTFVSGTVDGYCTVVVPMLRVTNKPGTQIVVNVYRTVANGTTYFLWGTSAFNTYGTVSNNPWANTVTFTDTAVSDAAILGNLQLYTTGALGDYAPPASSALSNFKNRAVQISSENPFQVGYSNACLQNFPVQFVPEFLINIGTVGGVLKTVAQMDDKMIFFKSGKEGTPAISYLSGQGPAQSGSGNDFQDPLPIATDTGCVDRPSVVLTPMGLMYKSDKGIYLLDRSLQVEYIGAPVEYYNQYSVLSSILVPNTTQVRYALSNGTMLMYDYFYKKWATFSNPAGVSDCIFQGQHTYVASDGTVYQESPGVYYDGTVTPVLWSFQTAWIKLAGLQGYQRAYFLYILATYISSHQLTVNLYTNFSTSADSTVTITPDSSSSLENWRVFFKNQRCQSFSVQIQEVSTGTLGAGCSVSGLNLIAGIKSGFTTISAAQSTG